MEAYLYLSIRFIAISLAAAAVHFLASGLLIAVKIFIAFVTISQIFLISIFRKEIAEHFRNKRRERK